MHGFELTRSEWIEELKLEAKFYRHLKTGSELLYLPCEDINKVFVIDFATHPTDHTGVPHIVEHAVLSGSDKYPLKETFTVLARGSMYTFLNAMTRNDGTCYPIASANAKDFLNLMDVYLDSVFHPSMLKDKRIFLQEGWRFDRNEDGEICYNGIVYSEMKGMMSIPEVKAQEASWKALYQGAYSVNAGGAPEFIPDLSYEDFVAFYKRFYHPANARFFLYGNLDLEAALAKIDQAIGSFNAGSHEEPIPPMKRPEKPQYQVLPFFSEEKEGNFGLYWIMGSNADIRKDYTLDVLFDALFNLESSPVRQKLLTSGFCQDISASYSKMESSYNLSLYFSGVSERDPEKAEQTVFDALRMVKAEELAPGLKAALNSLAFALREAEMGSTPKGIIFAMYALAFWSNGLDPLAALRYEDALKAVGGELESGRIYRLIESELLENTHRLAVSLVPDGGLSSAQAEEEKARAEKAWNLLSEEEKARVEAENAELKKRQAESEDPEILARVPHVTLEDVGKSCLLRDPEKVALDDKDITFYHYDIFTSHILNLEFAFSLDAVSPDELFLLGLLNDLLLKVDTDKHSYSELNNLILSETGGMRVSLSFHPECNILSARLKVLPEQLEKGLELLQEVLCKSDFSSTARLREILNMTRLQMREIMIANGSGMASTHVASMLTPEGAAYEATNGVGFYRELQSCLAGELKLSDALARLLARIINRKNMTIGLVGDKEDRRAFLAALPAFLEKLPRNEFDTAFSLRPYAKSRKAMLTSADVYFAAMGGLLPSVEGKTGINGHIFVLRNFLQTDYLWNEIRAKGGAYGTELMISRSGSIIFSSYRDPENKATLDVFRRTPGYLRGLRISDSELESIKINSISRFDQPVSPALEGMAAIRRVMQKLSLETMSRERREILETRQEDLRAFADPFEQLLSDPCYCIFGKAAGLQSKKELFDELVSLL